MSLKILKIFSPMIANVGTLVFIVWQTKAYYIFFCCLQSLKGMGYDVSLSSFLASQKSAFFEVAVNLISFISKVRKEKATRWSRRRHRKQLTDSEKRVRAEWPVVWNRESTAHLAVAFERVLTAVNSAWFNFNCAFATVTWARITLSRVARHDLWHSSATARHRLAIIFFFLLFIPAVTTTRRTFVPIAKVRERERVSSLNVYKTRPFSRRKIVIAREDTSGRDIKFQWPLRAERKRRLKHETRLLPSRLSSTRNYLLHVWIWMSPFLCLSVGFALCGISTLKSTYVIRASISSGA